MSRLIDADNVKKRIEESVSNYFGEYSVDMLNMWGLFTKMIDETPTVDTTCPHCDSGYAQGYSDEYLKGIEEKPTGEWVEKVETKQIGLDWLTTHEIVCSVCGGSGESDENIFQCWKFCPHCGAKMKGGAE